ncbi:MAG: adenylate/guanylate cyclase domain-containing protein [Thiomargarita sp.]|nr:adenylate/guanylate cyclase domain-containing protein [Thiomargarita sp.]
MNQNGNSIRWRLLVTMLGLIITLLTTQTYVQIQAQQSLLEKGLRHRELLLKLKMEQQGENIASNLANQVAIEIAALNLSKVEELVKLVVKENSDLKYGILMDGERTAHIHTQNPELEYEILIAPEDMFAAQQVTKSYQRLRRDGINMIEFVSPIPVNTQTWFLRLGFSMATVTTEISTHRWQIREQIKIMMIRSIATALLILAFSIILIIMIADRISKPLVELTKAAKNLADGDFDAEIPVYDVCQDDSKDEIAVLAMTFANMAENLRTSYKQLEKYNKAYERFVPHKLLNLLDKKNIIEIKLGDQIEKEMTILFSDIRGFTALSEKMTPQENFDFINAYLGVMEPIVHKYNGIIDKYIGDAIMALFPSNADDALQSAIAMLEELVTFNQVMHERNNCKAIKIGIGLHTGKLMFGTIGGENRMDGTVISDTVNLASRIEGMTKMYGISLLISEDTYGKLQEKSLYKIRPLDKVKVQGKLHPVTVYEVFNGDNLAEYKVLGQQVLKLGLEHYYQRQFKIASNYFYKLKAICPKDQAAHIYLKRCQHFIKFGVPNDWDGIEKLEYK